MPVLKIPLGHGYTLFVWAATAVHNLGETPLKITADPGAGAYYGVMGATHDGAKPSVSMPGNNLPRLFLLL
jgi:hypothetical protein